MISCAFQLWHQGAMQPNSPWAFFIVPRLALPLPSRRRLSPMAAVRREKRARNILSPARLPGVFPPWDDAWTAVTPYLFSVWQCYRYKKEVDEFTRHYNSSTDKPANAYRTPSIISFGWTNSTDVIDNTADETDSDVAVAGIQVTGVVQTASAFTQKDIRDLTPDVRKKLAADHAGWTYADPVELEADKDHYRLIDEPFTAPFYTLKHDRDGKPVYTDENYWRMMPLKYKPPTINPKAFRSLVCRQKRAGLYPALPEVPRSMNCTIRILPRDLLRTRRRSIQILPPPR